jgi:Acid Phosphatase
MVSSFPDYERNALRHLKLPPNGETADSFFDSSGGKRRDGVRHLEALQRKTGVSFSEMLFFGGMDGNDEMISLGVAFVQAITPTGGLREELTRTVFEKGMDEWRRTQQTKHIQAE